MAKKVNKLKINLETLLPLLAAAVAISIISSVNEHQAKKTEEQIWQNNLVTFEETFVKADRTIEDVELEKIIIPEGLEIEENTQEEEVGFSK